MAAIHISTLSLCSGGGHVRIQGTVNGNAIDRWYAKSILSDEANDLGLENRVLVRLISACKEAGATTNLQIKNALEGKDFKV